jgi:hypothetical protein
MRERKLVELYRSDEAEYQRELDKRGLSFRISYT